MYVRLGSFDPINASPKKTVPKPTRSKISSSPPSWPITINGTGVWTFYATGAAEYKIEIIGVPAVGGTWTATPSTGTVSAGMNTITFAIQGVGVDLSSMPPGEQKIAEIRFYTR